VPIPTYELFDTLVWVAERHLADRDRHGLRVTASVLSELACEDRVASKLARDEALRSRWDRVWAATDDEALDRFQWSPGSASYTPPAAALAASMVQAAEVWLAEGDTVSVEVLLPRLAHLEAVHGPEVLFPGEMAERVDAVRFAMKDADHRG
jgi:hypothetical protein